MLARFKKFLRDRRIRVEIGRIMFTEFDRRGFAPSSVSVCPRYDYENRFWTIDIEDPDGRRLVWGTFLW